MFAKAGIGGRAAAYNRLVKTLGGPDPTAPELAPIEAIHRNGDGVVTFHRKDVDGEFRNLFGIRTEHLSGMFPQFREQLEQDSFFSLNAFWHWEKGQHYIAAVQARKPERLRYLNACYVDIDCHKLGISFGHALGAVADLEEQGEIPPSSIVVRSGRGMWLLWLLHDPKNPTTSPRAWPEKLLLYYEVQRAIGERFAEIGADAAAKDSLRLARVPGSVHTVSGLRVKYRIQLDEYGHGFTYSLKELAGWFGVDTEKPKRVRGALTEAEKPKNDRRRGWEALNRYRLSDFEVLRSMRGGFSQGMRNRAAAIYAWLLRCNGVSKDEAARELSRLGAQCRPSLTPGECRAAIKTGYSRKGLGTIRYQTISDWLEITPEEADQLQKFPPATRHGVVRVIEEKPAKAKVLRQHALQEIIFELKRVPPLREMVRLLKDRGLSGSVRTVLLDYNELGIQTGRTKDAALDKVRQVALF